MYRSIFDELKKYDPSVDMHNNEDIHIGHLLNVLFVTRHVTCL